MHNNTSCHQGLSYGHADDGKRHRCDKNKQITYHEVVKLGDLRKRFSHFIGRGKLTPVQKALMVALPEDPPLILRGDVLHAHWRLHMHNGDSWTERRSVLQISH